MFKKLLTLIVLLTPITLHAEEKLASKWSGEAELGYLSTTGNSDTTSLHANGKIVNEREKWKHTGTMQITNKDNDGTTTAKRLFVTGKSDYNINDLSYLFITASYDDDEFSGYQYQLAGAFGYGYHVIKKENLKLDLEAGLGARQSKFNSGESNSEGIVRVAGDFEWTISKTSVFNQFISVEAGEDNTISRSVTSLSMQIVGNLAAKLSYNVRHNSDVPPGIEKTDTESVVTIVYKF